jgi:hypothetical protein
MPQDDSETTASEEILIAARLAAGEAQENRDRILSLLAGEGLRRIEFTEAEGMIYATAVSLQLCLATAAQLRAAGRDPIFGPEAQRLLAAQTLL